MGTSRDGSPDLVRWLALCPQADIHLRAPYTPCGHSASFCRYPSLGFAVRAQPTVVSGLPTPPPMHSTRGAPSTSITEAARAPLLARRERLQLLGEVGHRLCPVHLCRFTPLRAVARVRLPTSTVPAPVLCRDERSDVASRRPCVYIHAHPAPDARARLSCTFSQEQTVSLFWT